MASRPTVRSSSRRTTPQSPPNVGHTRQAQTRRATRSQSHDVSEAESIGPFIRRSTRKPSALPDAGRLGLQRAQAAEVQPAQDLSIVAEDSDYEESDAGSPELSPDSDGGDEEQVQQNLNSPGASSAISGTTARTSHSAQELADLSSEEMLDALPDLADASDKLLNHLLFQDVSQSNTERVAKSLQDPRSRTRKTMNRLTSSFVLHKEVYGNEAYINISIAIRGVLGVRRMDQVGEGPWRPDDILYKANLANMVMNMLSIPPHSNQPFLEKMERDFPAPFLSQLVTTKESAKSSGASVLVNDTFEAAFQLRVQFFLSMLGRNQGQSGFDPDNLLSAVFYEDPSSIKGWDVDGLRSQDLNKWQINTITERLERIQGNFDGEQVVDIDALKLAYPWTTCLSNLVSWAILRKDEIEAHLTSCGGVGNIKERLGQEALHRAEVMAGSREKSSGGESPRIEIYYPPLSELSHPASDQVEPLNVVVDQIVRSASKVTPGFNRPVAVGFAKRKAAGGTPQQNGNYGQSVTFRQPSGIYQISATAGPSIASESLNIRTHQSKIPASAPAKITDDMIVGGIMNDEWQPQAEEEELNLQPVSNISPNERRRRILVTHNESVAEQNKENRPQTLPSSTVSPKTRLFIDRQSNAEKISFESQPRSTQRSLPSSSAQRPQLEDTDNDEDMSDPSEDEGFQQDSRPIAPRSSLLNRVAFKSAMKSPARRVRLSEPREERERTRSLDPDYTEAVEQANGQIPLSQIEIYTAVNKEAKSLTALHIPKPVQTRRPWTTDETHTLIELITHHGISWTRLKSLDEEKVLLHRDQVALKDKARNIKIDFLKTGVELPANFDMVPLKKTDLARLRRLRVGLQAHNYADDSDDNQ